MKIKYCKRPGFLKGGMGQHTDPRSVNQRALKAGMKVEMEHTNNKCAAMWVAIDHLTEFPGDYYKELAKMERKLKSKGK